MIKKYMPTTRGKALDAVAARYGLRRRFYERLPWFGDNWLRARIAQAVLAHLERG